MDLDQRERKRYLTIQDVAQMLHISYRSARELFHKKDFPTFQVGRRFLVDDMELTQYLNAYQHGKIYVS